ncbi:MAG: GNAT family N-acetyltransferase [Oscillospiraceae bacterium]|nr:GNAT family N-acetyltransferase [Oscillospiraceae bacterium]
MIFQTYRDSDYDAVCGFLIELNREQQAHINWNWARFEWMAEHPYFDRGLRGSIGLWRDRDRVVGAAIYDMYFGEAFCGALPAYASLYPEILDYAYRVLKDSEGLAVSIGEENAGEIEAAERAGFVRTEQQETVMRCELDRPFPVSLPDGFTLKELDPYHGGAYELQWLFWQGFDHGDDRAAFEEDYERTMNSGLGIRPHFRPGLSVAAHAPDGEAAAYACLWYDERTDYAYVEPVCTIPRHRGKGLGRAVVCEAMNRAAELGAKKAYVISDQPFYEKLGFVRDRRFVFYRKR